MLALMQQRAKELQLHSHFASYVRESEATIAKQPLVFKKEMVRDFASGLRCVIAAGDID